MKALFLFKQIKNIYLPVYLSRKTRGLVLSIIDAFVYTQLNLRF